jgi:hypothetical protein
MTGKPAVTCADCGLTLDESPHIKPEDRAPCPRCGSLGRKFLLLLEGSVHGRGTVSAEVTVIRAGASVDEAAEIAPPEQARERPEEGHLEVNFNVKWYVYPDGLYLGQLYDEPGERLDGRGGDDPVDALLEVAERLQPNPPPGTSQQG